MTPERAHMEAHVLALFKHATAGNWVSLRAFFEGRADLPPFKITPIRLNGDLDILIDQAYQNAELAARSHEKVVFCPPIATFTNSKHAREQDLAEGLALSVECDAHAWAAAKKLEELLGPATVGVESGGEWTDPETGESESKLHVHYRLKTPARSKHELEKLKLARKLAAKIVGGDPSNVPLVHPIRWPGSLHRKGDPKLCRIVALNPDAEIDLDTALEILRAHATNSGGIDAPPEPIFTPLEGKNADQPDPPPEKFSQMAPAFAHLDPTDELGEDIPKLPPLPFAPIKAECGWLRHVHETGGADQREPLWKLALNCCTFLADSESLIHELSNKHKGYDSDATKAKYAHARQDQQTKDLGWPLCKTIHDHGSTHCEACPHLAKGKSPLNLALPAIRSGQGNDQEIEARKGNGQGAPGGAAGQQGAGGPAGGGGGGDDDDGGGPGDAPNIGGASDTSILYHQPEVIEAIANDHEIVCVKDEKTADRLGAIGIPATCATHDPAKSPTRKWTAEHSEQLRDAAIVVIPDHDDAGYTHARATCKYSLGVCRRVRLLMLHDHWPDCPKGGNVSDYLDASHTREQLDALIARAPDYTSQEAGQGGQDGGDGQGDGSGTEGADAADGAGSGQAEDPLEARIPAETWATLKDPRGGWREFFNVMLVLKANGLTLEHIIALFNRFPDGLAAQYRGRLEYKVKTDWTKIKIDDPQPLQEGGSLDEWDAGDDPGVIPPRQWLLGNQFCRGFISSIVAAGGAGKSALRMLQFISLAIGRSLCGQHVFKRCRVLLISLEDDRNELQRRIQAVLDYYGIDRKELKGWLFCASPKLAKLAEIKDRTRTIGPLERQIREAIARRNPDIIGLDPFIKTHSLEENDSGDMDFVCDLLARMAIEFNIAVDSPHHQHKGQVTPGDADSGRGSSGIKDAGRLVYTLTPMSEAEAKIFNIDPNDRFSYVRLDSAKVNLTVRSGKAEWFHIIGQPIGNRTDEYPNGDTIQVPEPWMPASPWAGTSSVDLNALLNNIDRGLVDENGKPTGQRYSNAPNATDRAVWPVVQKHYPDKTEGQCREIIHAWLDTKLLYPENYDDPVERKPRKGLKVDDSKRPT
jgi:AAA domain